MRQCSVRIPAVRFQPVHSGDVIDQPLGDQMNDNKIVTTRQTRPEETDVKREIIPFA